MNKIRKNTKYLIMDRDVLHSSLSLNAKGLYFVIMYVFGGSCEIKELHKRCSDSDIEINDAIQELISNNIILFDE